MDELTDSSGLVPEPEALRKQLTTDGYLYFRGLLPADQVRAAGAAVLTRLSDGGWTDESGAPTGTRRALNSHDALSDRAFRAALLCAEFNRIPYLSPLRTVVRRVLGPRAFSYPAKVLRAVYPEVAGERARGRFIHYDYAVGGGQDMLTSWLPLMDIPVSLGGLAIQPGGHYWPPQRPRPLSGTEPGWATSHYRPGDVLIFHCLTPHAALPNTADTLRISGDFRWQLPDHPAPTEMILGPARVGTGQEMYGRLFAREPWWEPIPADLPLAPREQQVAIPPGPSRFFAVNPAWQGWQPPPRIPH